MEDLVKCSNCDHVDVMVVPDGMCIPDFHRLMKDYRCKECFYGKNTFKVEHDDTDFYVVWYIDNKFEDVVGGPYATAEEAQHDISYVFSDNALYGG